MIRIDSASGRTSLTMIRLFSIINKIWVIIGLHDPIWKA
jgi:hypothetical protein